MRNLSPLALTLTCGLLAAACSSSSPGGGTGSGGHASGGSSSGGSTGSSGGSTGSSGGSTGSGGNIASGGRAGFGGNTASAGTNGFGGNAAGGNTSGGTTGSGGAAGHAGNTGMGGASQGPGGSASGCPTNAVFCADFENGQIPSSATYYPAYQQSMNSMYVNVDGTMGANGSIHSLKVTAGSNFSQMLGVPTGTATFWTRFYIRTNYPSSMVSGHDTFVNATDGNGDPNSGAQIRLGEHSCQIEVNQQPGDAEVLSDALNGSSNYTCGGGISFNADTWYCVEMLFDGPHSTIRIFVDGTESTALNVTTWGPYMYDMFKFGFENYGASFTMNGNPFSRFVWYDDLVIAPQQVHCR